MNKQRIKSCIMIMPSLVSRLEELQETADHVNLSVDELCECIILEWLEEGSGEQNDQGK